MIDIQPEDRVILTDEQKELLKLAMEKQFPVDDIKILESIHENNNTPRQKHKEMRAYYYAKYGEEFGSIYLCAITDGEEVCKEAILLREELNAARRIAREHNN